jgi:hypothetical protein
MKRKFSTTVVIVFSAFMLSVSVMSFQQRYDRRKEDSEQNPNVIELTDLHAFKFLKNLYFFEFPVGEAAIHQETYFFNEEAGFGNHHTVVFHPFASCHLKFVLIEYIGFYSREKEYNTFFPDFMITS